MLCPSIDVILAMRKGLLPEPEKTNVAAHISTGCSSCAEKQRLLTDLLSLDGSSDFPESTHYRSTPQFRAAGTPPPETNRIPAQLIFDRFVPSRSLDARWTAMSAANRQTLYRAAIYDLDIRVEQLGGESLWRLIGQVSSRQHPNTGSSGRKARLFRLEPESGSAHARQTFIDSRGIFHMRNVQSGRYDLVVEVLEGELFIHALSCELK